MCIHPLCVWIALFVHISSSIRLSLTVLCKIGRKSSKEKSERSQKEGARVYTKLRVSGRTILPKIIQPVLPALRLTLRQRRKRRQPPQHGSTPCTCRLFLEEAQCEDGVEELGGVIEEVVVERRVRVVFYCAQDVLRLVGGGAG